MNLLPVIAQRNRSASAYDSDVVAFASVSGATDLVAINNLVVYLKAQSLWSNCRFFPFKSAQNAGAGTTVYGLGGWTSNDITLANGPTWGAGGVAFDGTDDRGAVTLTGLGALNSLTVFDRQLPSQASAADQNRFGGIYVRNTPDHYLIFNHGSGLLSGETVGMSANKTSDFRRAGTNGITWAAGADTQIVTTLALPASIWKSKTAASITTTSGTQDFRPSQIPLLGTDTLSLNYSYDGTVYVGFYAHTRVSLMACKAVLTTQQREDITDYLQAL